MKKKSIIILALVFLGLILISSSAYIIREDEIALVKQFGKIKRVIINTQDYDKVKNNFEVNGNTNVKIKREKGLHFKAPFFETIERYDSKYLTYTSRTEKTNTKDGRSIDIQMYAQYRIVDPVKFNEAVISEHGANSVMDKNLYPVVIQSANTLIFDEFFQSQILESHITEKLDELNKKLLVEFGIFVTDVGVNRKTFPAENVASIEGKMSKQIEKESEKLIAEGDSAYQKAKATTDRQRKELIASAIEKAAITKAEADAEAIKIYQQSLNKDLEFYKFIQRMNIYKNLKDTTIFLDKNNDLLEYINGYK
ncbi:MAG: SPFH domain-containing protein [Vallitalea sp.]|jgi:membrane protease subunit HflC|nr:SPFH domain-containing protein [Vallitalea sp.]